MHARVISFLAEPPQLEEYEVLVQAGHHVGGRSARVITLPISDRHLGPARAVYEAEYLPLLKQQPGFQGVLSRLAEYFTAPTQMGYYAVDAQL